MADTKILKKKSKKNNLKNVLEALPTGIMLVGRDAVVRWANKPLLELFRISWEELVGQRFGDGAQCIYSYEKGCGEGEKCRLCEIRKSINTVIREGTNLKDIVLKHSFLSHDGEKNFWLKVNFIPLASPNESQIVIAIEDITEQINYESVLQRSRDEAESANIIKSEFIANMSHEIRTPLNGLIGMMDLLLQTPMSMEQTEYIRMAKISADTLLKVINDILDFSRIEAGKLPIENVSFDIRALMDEIMKIHEILAEKKGLELHWDCSSQVPPYVMGDPDRLRQIMNNLIGNAIKFTDAGMITVTVRNIPGDDEKATVEFSVSDTGIGISKEKMELLFKRFSQVDGTITRRHSGTGLGLAICKELVELMGGMIHGESQEGKGSTFRFTMPFIPGSGILENAVQGSALKRERALQPIIMDGGEFVRPIPEKPANKSERVVILEDQGDFEKSSRIRLGENGEIIFGKAAEPAAGEDISRELDELYRLLRKLESIVRECRFSIIGETAYRIKKAALQIGADELADLAFKAQLASRKFKWDDAAEYCVMMINEINFRYREGRQ